MAAVQSLTGQKIGQYELQELLGIGGMSAVYHAYQRPLDRHVAIKVLPESLVKEHEFVKRFLLEAKIVAKLEHPNIVPIYDYGTNKGITYVVMRLLSGGTLAQRLDYRLYYHEPLPSLGE